MNRNQTSGGLHKSLLSIIRNLPGPRERRTALAAVLWQQVVGTILGQHSHVNEMDNRGILHIHLDDPVWEKALRSSRKHILNAMNRKRVLDIPAAGLQCMVRKPEAPKRKNSPLPKTVDEDVLSQIAESVPDDKLRERIIAAFRKYPDQN